jgi:hypothetical protein
MHGLRVIRSYICASRNEFIKLARSLNFAVVYGVYGHPTLCHCEKQNGVKIDVTLKLKHYGVERINSRKRPVITTAAACFGETALPTHVLLFILFADSVIYMTSRSV